MHKPTHLFTLPYADRQFLVVVDDEAASAARQAETWARSDSQPGPFRWSEIVQHALVAIQPVGGPPVVEGAAVRDALEGWGAVRSLGRPVFLAGQSEVASVRFPPGHPRPGIVYVGHPAVVDVYYTVAAFHRFVFEHKVAEAVKMLTALGAKEMHIRRVHGWGQEFAASLQLPGVQPAFAKGGDEVLFAATMDGLAPPRLPEDLAWQPHEHGWRMVADGRLQGGMQQFSLNLAYDDDFGVNDEVVAVFVDAGLQLGGRVKPMTETLWHITGVFARTGATNL